MLILPCSFAILATLKVVVEFTPMVRSSFAVTKACHAYKWICFIRRACTRHRFDHVMQVNFTSRTFKIRRPSSLLEVRLGDLITSYTCASCMRHRKFGTELQLSYVAGTLGMIILTWSGITRRLSMFFIKSDQIP